MPMIDATKWDEFYQEMTKDLKPYDHYDDGYRDAMAVSYTHLTLPTKA